MKVKLIYELPEEEYEYKLATEAINVRLAISDFDSYLRTMCKHTEMSEEQNEICWEIRDQLYMIFDDREVCVID